MRILSPLSLILILARAFAKEYELGDFVISIDETNTVPNPRLSVTTAQGVVVWKSQEEQDVGKRRLSHDETTADEPDYTDASFRTHHNNPSSSPIIPWKKKSPLPFLAVAVAKVTKGPIIDTFLDMKESIDKSTKTDGLRITDVTKTKKMGKTYEVKITGELYQVRRRNTSRGARTCLRHSVHSRERLFFNILDVAHMLGTHFTRVSARSSTFLTSLTCLLLISLV